MDLERENMRRIETLQRMMDELCAPDLTIARANDLRPRLYELLGMANDEEVEQEAPKVKAPHVLRKQRV